MALPPTRNFGWSRFSLVGLLGTWGSPWRRNMRTSSRLGWLVRAPGLLLVLVLVLAALSPAQAGPLPEFTGYTRVGFPPTNEKDVNPKMAEWAGKVQALGMTIYYMVLDREEGE